MIHSFSRENLQSKVYDLKSKYKYIYLLNIDDLMVSKSEFAPDAVVIRPLTRREFNFYANDQIYSIEESTQAIIQRCVVWPDNFNLELFSSIYSFGIDAYISRAIINISCFASEDALAEGVEHSRKYALTLEGIITQMICKAFPRYTPDDVEDMAFHDQIKLVSMAEQMTGYQVPYLEILHPEVIEDQKKEHKKNKSKRQMDRIRQSIGDEMPPLPSPPPGYESHGGSRKQLAKEIVNDRRAMTKEEIFESMKDIDGFLNG